MIRLKYYFSLSSILCLFFIANIQVVLAIGMPIDCKLGHDCWIVNLQRHYITDNPAGKQVDYLCGSKTYDGHKGTDFAIRDIEVMQQGVNVIATTDAVVRGVRDGMEDISIRESGQDAIKGRECGNGVVLRSGDFEYQYCHLKKWSIAVSKGQTVKKDDVLGEVGLSGNTEYPHVHLSVRKKRGDTWIEYDPFYGRGYKCGLDPKPIWDNADMLARHINTGMVYHYGFSYEVPDINKVRKGYYNNLSYESNPKMIIAWMEVFSADAGDKIVFSLYTDDADQPLIKEHEFKKYKARYFFYLGKKLNGKELAYTTKLLIEYHHADGRIEYFENQLK